jgi:hypothetical protein
MQSNSMLFIKISPKKIQNIVKITIQNFWKGSFKAQGASKIYPEPQKQTIEHFFELVSL